MHYQSKSTASKKQQVLLRSQEMASINPLYAGTFRVRTLNRCGSAQVGSSMLHLQTRPVHNYPRNIQAVTLHPHQFGRLQITAKCREEMLRKNHDQIDTVIRYELSSAPSHSTGAHYQTQSQVAETSRSDEARGLTHGQQPQPAQTALHTSTQSPLKRDTPPHGNKRSLARCAGEILKWRDLSHTIGRHAQWTRQYNGVRHLLQYVRWQAVHPQLAPISEWEEEISHEELQKLQMTTASSNHSFTSLECQDCPIIHRTSTPCSQLMQLEREATANVNCDRRLDNLQVVSALLSCGPSENDGESHDAFPENAGKIISNFHQHSTKECYTTLPETRKKCMRKPKYNCKFTGCVQGKRRVSVEWISNNNQQSLCTSNGNVETLHVFSYMPRQFHSHINLYDRGQQSTLTPITAPATADNGASVASTRVPARRAVPVMSTCSLCQQHGISLSSPTTAYPPEIEWNDAATNALYTVSMLQNVGLNTLYDRARNSKSMLQSYVHSFERRPKVYMARTKGSIQREKERDKDSDRRPAERSKAKPGKKGRRRHSPRQSQYVCYFCSKVNKQRTNHKRHMIMKHACRLDGTVATPEDIAQARAWASKERVDRSQQFKSKEYVSSN